MRGMIKDILQESIDVKYGVLENLVPAIEETAEVMVHCLEYGHKIMVCGNGGSATDAQHMTGELVGRFERNRRGLPCIALTADAAVMTAVSNDFGYETVFSRQVEALGVLDDLLIGISTSGNSQNILRAFETAREIGVKCVGLLGRGGGKIGKLDYVRSVIVPSESTARIQESHLTIYHIWCKLIEDHFCPEEEL